MITPAEITVNDQAVIVTAIYPDDGALGSVTFDADGQTARGAVFLTSQNGIPPEEVPEPAVIAAIAAVI